MGDHLEELGFLAYSRRYDREERWLRRVISGGEWTRVANRDREIVSKTRLQHTKSVQGGHAR